MQLADDHGRRLCFSATHAISPVPLLLLLLLLVCIRSDRFPADGCFCLLFRPRPVAESNHYRPTVQFCARSEPLARFVGREFERNRIQIRPPGSFITIQKGRRFYRRCPTAAACENLAQVPLQQQQQRQRKQLN